MITQLILQLSKAFLFKRKNRAYNISCGVFVGSEHFHMHLLYFLNYIFVILPQSKKYNYGIHVY